jgi:PAS domain S-box-containing protein
MAPAGLGLLDASGRVLEATPAFWDILGSTARSPGRELGELFTTSENPGDVAAALSSLRRGKAIELEAWCLRPDRGRAAVCLAAAPFALANSPAAFYCVVRDVTQQRLDAEEYARALSLHQATLTSTADGLLVVDLAGKVLSFNERFLAMWRIPKDASLSGQDADLLNAVLHQLVDPTGFLRRVAELYAHPDDTGSDEIRLQDGRVFERYSQPQRHAGRSVGRVWSFRDVTEARKAAEALRESQHLLELFFSQSLDGCFFMMLDTPLMWDEGTDKEAALDYVFAHERVSRVNAALLAQYGAREVDLIGRTPADLLAHDIAAARARWRDLLDAGRAHVETNERTLDGRSIIVEGHRICLYDRAGRVVGHFGNQRDVTSRRAAEDELVRSREELRNLTARLQAVREEERTAIARDVHDELGQTLTGLKIDLSWLRAHLAHESQQAACIQSLIERTDGAMNTVRRIATRLRPSVLDHLGLVAAVEWLAAEFERSTGIEVQLDVRAVDAEPDQRSATTVFRILQEALANLPGQGGPSATHISLRGDDGLLHLEIVDNGAGIAEADRQSPTLLRLVGIRERAIACGGDAVIRRAPGQGTRLSVTVPLTFTRETEP